MDWNLIVALLYESFTCNGFLNELNNFVTKISIDLQANKI